MDESDLNKKLYFYGLYATSIIFLLISLFTGYLYIIIISSLFLLLSILYLHSGHIINNLLIKKSMIIEIANNYVLSQNLLSVVKKDNDFYKGVSVASIRQNGQANISSESIKSLIESIHEPFEFSIFCSEIDKKRIIEPLETKKKMKEIQLTKIKDGKYDKISALRREIDIITGEIENIRLSGKAYDVLLLIKAFGSSDSESEASSQSLKTLYRVADSFSAALKLDYEVLSGETLLSLFK
ncbi:MAG: hypothetical protein ACP5M9_01815 [Candidatus Micrarchaeia archaeon]